VLTVGNAAKALRSSHPGTNTCFRVCANDIADGDVLAPFAKKLGLRRRRDALLSDGRHGLFTVGADSKRLRLIAYRSFGDGIEFQIVRQRAGGAEYSLLLLVVLTLYRHHEEGAAGTRPA
jgi:hypothetical protein